MGKASLVFVIGACILGVAAAFPGYHGHVRPTMPAPEPMAAAPTGGDCSTVVYELAECVSYMTIPAVEKKASKECCESLKSVYEYGGECVCVGLEMAPSIGFQVNYSRAFSLPTACNLPFLHCQFTPAVAPVKSKSPSPIAPVNSKKPIAVAPASSTRRSGEGSGCSSLSTSVVLMVVGALCYTLAY